MPTQGKLIFKEVNFEQVLVKTVVSNNKTSGKVQLPKDMIGKTVYVVLIQDEPVGGVSKDDQ